MREALAAPACMLAASPARACAACWLWSRAVRCCCTARCASAAAAACCSAALATFSAPRWASRALASASTAASSTAWATSAMTCISPRTVSSVATTPRPASASAWAWVAIALIRAAISRTSARIASVMPCTSPALRSEVSAKARTSSATTAKPRPCSPARAASMAALRASRLVWSAMSPMVVVISSMLPTWLLEGGDHLDRADLPRRVVLEPAGGGIDLDAHLGQQGLQRIGLAPRLLGPAAGLREGADQAVDRRLRLLRGAGGLLGGGGDLLERLAQLLGRGAGLGDAGGQFLGRPADAFGGLLPAGARPVLAAPLDLAGPGRDVRLDRRPGGRRDAEAADVGSLDQGHTTLRGREAPHYHVRPRNASRDTGPHGYRLQNVMDASTNGVISHLVDDGVSNVLAVLWCKHPPPGRNRPSAPAGTACNKGDCAMTCRDLSHRDVSHRQPAAGRACACRRR